MSLTIEDKEEARPVVGDTLRLAVRGLKDITGRPWNLSLAETFYLSIKSDLGMPDVDAEVFVDSDTYPELFDTTYVADGSLTVRVDRSMTSGLTAGVSYYIDLKVLLKNGMVYTLVYDTIVFDEPVTKAP